MSFAYMYSLLPHCCCGWSQAPARSLSSPCGRYFGMPCRTHQSLCRLCMIMLLSSCCDLVAVVSVRTSESPPAAASAAVVSPSFESSTPVA